MYSISGTCRPTEPPTDRPSHFVEESGYIREIKDKYCHQHMSVNKTTIFALGAELVCISLFIVNIAFCSQFQRYRRQTMTPFHPSLYLSHTHTHTHTPPPPPPPPPLVFWGFLIRKEGNVLFNDALNTFYLRLYGVGHMVKDIQIFKISSKGYFICTTPQTGWHIPRPLVHQSWSIGWNEK